MIFNGGVQFPYSQYGLALFIGLLFFEKHFYSIRFCMLFESDSLLLLEESADITSTSSSFSLWYPGGSDKKSLLWLGGNIFVAISPDCQAYCGARTSGDLPEASASPGKWPLTPFVGGLLIWPIIHFSSLNQLGTVSVGPLEPRPVGCTQHHLH